MLRHIRLHVCYFHPGLLALLLAFCLKRLLRTPPDTTLLPQSQWGPVPSVKQCLTVVMTLVGLRLPIKQSSL